MYTITNGLTSTALLMAAAKPFRSIESMRSDCEYKIPKIEGVGRDSLVCAQIRKFEGFENLEKLRHLIEETDPSLPLDDIDQVKKVHAVISDEISQHPFLYIHDKIIPKSSDPASPKIDYFWSTDPEAIRTFTQIFEARPIHNNQGAIIGQAVICAGGKERLIEAHEFEDGSRISASTTAGDRNYQYNAFYYCFYELSAGVYIKTLAASDGTDQCDGSELAVSAFLQGVHAACVKSARKGLFPDPLLLYRHGRKVMALQKERHHIHTHAGGTALIAVILGNKAFIVTCGDTMLAFSRKLQSGRYKTIGYSQVDCNEQKNILPATIATFPTLYKVEDMKPGDRLTIGTDGFWETILPEGSKARLSGNLQSQFHQNFPTQKMFRTLNHLNYKSCGHLLSAQYYVHCALRDPVVVKIIFGIMNALSFFPTIETHDNLLVIDYEHGQVADENLGLILPFGHWNLEKIY